MKRIISGTLLILSLMAMLSLALNIKSTKAEWTGTVYIRADGSIDSPDAPIITYDNITYTLTDNITSSVCGIVVERDNIIIDGAGHGVRGSYSRFSAGIVLWERSNVTIQNIEITAFNIGIWLYSSSNNNIIGNYIARHGMCGIYIYGSSNIVYANRIENTMDYGVELFSSFDNRVSGNNITNGRVGILVHSSKNNIISDNNIINNDVGINLFDSLSNIIVGNNIRNDAIANWPNWQYGIILSSSNNNMLAKNNVTKNLFGICLSESSNNTLRDNTMNGNRYNFGLYVTYKEEPSIFINDIDESNTINGKPIYYWTNKHGVSVPKNAGYVALINCTNVTIKSLELKNNLQGLLLVNVRNSTITKNNIAANYYAGVWLYSSSNNIISANNIEENSIGLSIHRSSNNTISGNNIRNNMGGLWWLWWSCGIELLGARFNSIYHNNFINNTKHVIVIGETHHNIWDDGYPSGGNYWDNYTSVDVYCGLYQNKTGSDGIGDTPYIIDPNNVDHYPLMSPCTPALITAVDIYPKILVLKDKGRIVTAYIELPKNYEITDINVSSILLMGTIPMNVETPTEIGDHNNNTIPDLMVNFDRTAVYQLILSKGITCGNITLTVSGSLIDGTPFEGSNKILVRMPGDINMDGKVDGRDIAIVSIAFGSFPEHLRWNPIADENEDNKIDIFDIALTCRNFGKTY
jgi:parallel beta-helix repeat protein